VRGFKLERAGEGQQRYWCFELLRILHSINGLNWRVRSRGQTTKPDPPSTAFGRVGAAEDCAGPSAFPLSPAAAYITVQVIVVVDGGLPVGQIGKL
jgi:NAD(P)-dependent dehydrogenase (short-subunit alcohol dehydrogenase family)